MKRLACGIGAMFVFALAAMVTAPPARAIDDEETPTIKEIMGKVTKGPTAALGVLKKQLQEKKPDWEAIQETAGTIVKFASFMPKNDPPKGEKADFEKLAKNFAESAKSIEKAAKAKDTAAVKKAMGKMGGSCMTCHKAHKGQ